MKYTRIFLPAFAAIICLSAFGCGIEEPMGDPCGTKNESYVLVLPSGLICTKTDFDNHREECKEHQEAFNVRRCPTYFYCHNINDEPNSDVSDVDAVYYCSNKHTCASNQHFNAESGTCEAGSK